MKIPTWLWYVLGAVAAYHVIVVLYALSKPDGIKRYTVLALYAPHLMWLL